MEIWKSWCCGSKRGWAEKIEWGALRFCIVCGLATFTPHCTWLKMSRLVLVSDCCCDSDCGSCLWHYSYASLTFGIVRGAHRENESNWEREKDGEIVPANDSQRPFSESQQVLKAAHSSSTCRHTQLMNKLQLQLHLPSNLPWKLELSLALFLSLVLLAVTVGCSPLPLPLRRKTKPAAMHFLPNARIRIPYTFATASTMLCSAQFA